MRSCLSYFNCFSLFWMLPSHVVWGDLTNLWCGISFPLYKLFSKGGLGPGHVCSIVTKFIVSMAQNRMLSSRLANQVNCQPHFGILWKESLGMDLDTFRLAVTGYLWISSQVFPNLSALRLNKPVHGMLLQRFLFSYPWCHFACPFSSGIDFLEPAGQYNSHQWIIFKLHFNNL